MGAKTGMAGMTMAETMEIKGKGADQFRRQASLEAVFGGAAQLTPWEEDMEWLRNFYRDDAGAVAVEHGIIVAFISIAVLGGVTAFGGAVGQMFDSFPIRLPL